MGSAGIGIFEIDVWHQRVRYSRELSAMLGFPHIRSARLEDACSRIHREDIERIQALYQKALAPEGDGRLRMQLRFVRPGGEIRWMTWNGEVGFERTRSGRVARRILGACTDITKQKRAEQVLRDRESFLVDVLDSLPQHVCVLDGNGVILAVNEPWQRFSHENGGDLSRAGIGVDYLAVCRVANDRGDPDADTALKGLSDVLARRRASFEMEYSCHSPQAQRWFTLHARRLPGEPAGLLVSHLDVSSRRRAEEQLRHVMREANHRTKNILSLVDVVARRTAASAPTDFIARFSQRLAALATIQDQLVEHGWLSLELRELICAQLAHFQDLIGSRILLSGPPVKLSARAVQPIGMALHELATNASKYGALASETGHIEICWQVEAPVHGQPRLALEWTEHGSPAPAHAGKRGFGSTLITQIPQAALGAEVDLEMHPSGCRWRLTCDLSRLTDD